MDTIEATLETVGDEVALRIGLLGDDMKIVFTEDNSRSVKQTFNKLLSRLKSGCFKIEFVSEDPSLFGNVAREYVNQLNRELGEVFQEMERHSLVSRTIPVDVKQLPV